MRRTGIWARLARRQPRRTPATGSVFAQDRRRRRRDGRAAIEAERIFRAMGAREARRPTRPSIVEAITTAERATHPGSSRWGASGSSATACRSRRRRGIEEGPRPAEDPRRAALAGRLTRDTFFELLWPDDDPEPLGNRLSVALATVRSVLDPRQRTRRSTSVPADKWLDRARPRAPRARRRGVRRQAAAAARLALLGRRAARRSKLEAAEALYGGDFLEEDPYEDWAVSLREEAQATTYISIAARSAEAARVGRRRRRRRPATTSGSSSATRTTRAPTSDWSPRWSRPDATARRGGATGSTRRRWRRSRLEAAPFPVGGTWPPGPCRLAGDFAAARLSERGPARLSGHRLVGPPWPTPSSTPTGARDLRAWRSGRLNGQLGRDLPLPAEPSSDRSWPRRA